MPNWCYNELEISREAAEKYLLAKGEEGDIIDFNKLIPMPESIKQTEAGGSNHIDVYLYLSEKLKKSPDEVLAENLELLKKIFYKFDADDAKKCLEQIEEKQLSAEETDTHYATGCRLMENYRLYGAINWYDWALRNWGSKWNGGKTEITDTENEQVILEFETPWAPPGGIIEALSKVADFKWIFDGENCGCCLAKEGQLYTAQIEPTYQENDDSTVTSELTYDRRKSEDGQEEFVVTEESEIWDEATDETTQESVTVAVICIGADGTYTVSAQEDAHYFEKDDVDAFIEQAACFEGLLKGITEVRPAQS